MRGPNAGEILIGHEANPSVSMSSPFKHSCAAALLLLTLSCAVAAPTAAAADESLQAIIQRIEHDNHCNVLSVQTMEHEGRKVYVIKTLTDDGRIKVVQVRASQ